ncbi:hypothetical protein QVD17_18480 [Tagetes erecta]|uniref:Uncharacterized protein n=1 Tax=Tagetes erecta TaxID=13708 RepID=A0AAD8KHU4_TARER|nr:hypothetical protein QVD17_18480 [Tagetes erecta]
MRRAMPDGHSVISGRSNGGCEEEEEEDDDDALMVISCHHPLSPATITIIVGNRYGCGDAGKIVGDEVGVGSVVGVGRYGL